MFAGDGAGCVWCHVAYWELRVRVGRLYHVTQDVLHVFQVLPRGDGLCLQVLQEGACDPAGNPGLHHHHSAAASPPGPSLQQHNVEPQVRDRFLSCECGQGMGPLGVLWARIRESVLHSITHWRSVCSAARNHRKRHILVSFVRVG